uniref:Anoctamin transmembrane domain-containing protein n=1 Tax=Hanusia phi TaxID=3032 RepID=A0A6T7R5R4_9CRYP|mmetsp:Transcript_27746/g.62836  ORF Transcript_27746/g.62836 Transcript_27746/m.62836 type:complete len:787 (+) Transcript_27746:179-2539(+)
MTSSGEIMLHLPDGETDIINDQGTTLGMLMQSDNHTHDEAAAHENLASRVRSTIHGIAAPAEVLAETMKKGLNKVSNAADQLVQAVRSDLAGGNVELADVSICRNRQNGEFMIQQDSVEDNYPNISFFCSRKELQDKFGMSIRQYYNFLNFITIANIILLLCSLIGWIPHAVNTFARLHEEGLGLQTVSGTQLLSVFLLSSFQPSTDGYWIAMLGLCYSISAILGPTYYLIDLFYFRDAPQEQFLERTMQLDQIDRKIKEGEDPDRLKKFRFMMLSYFLFLLCLGIPVAVMYFILFGLNRMMIQENYKVATNFPTSFSGTSQLLLALLAISTSSIANFVFGLVAGLLTDLELHVTWTGYRNHRLAKLVVYRICNTMALLFFTYYAEVPWYTCMITRIALQTILFVVMDLVVTLMLQMISPFVYQWWLNLINCRPCCEDKQDTREPFELTEEYFKLVFRQYLLYVALPLCPLFSAATLVCNVIELPLNKFRLLRLTRRPQGMVGGRRLICIALFGAFVAAVITFPSGPVFFFPPWGPFLCWPCPTYSQVGTAGGACGGAFEATTCRGNGGQVITVDELRLWLARAKSGDERQSAAAEDFFSYHSRLFYSRRCICRPCIQAITCSCSAPVEQAACLQTNKLVCGGGSNVSGARCDVEEKQSGQCRGGACEVGLDWTVLQCGRGRYQYSFSNSSKHISTCRGGRDDAKPCSSHEECAGGFCDFYCPIPLAASAQHATHTPCWLCPESMVGGLVNPTLAKRSWEELPFCKLCFRNSPSCVCSRRCNLTSF